VSAAARAEPEANGFTASRERFESVLAFPGRDSSMTIFAASSLYSGVNDRRFFDTYVLSSGKEP